MTQKVMKLIDERSGLMECKVCGKKHLASLQAGVDRADGITRFYRGSWQCENGCSLEKKSEDKS